MRILCNRGWGGGYKNRGKCICYEWKAPSLSLKLPNTQYIVVEICSESLVRAIG